MTRPSPQTDLKACVSAPQSSRFSLLCAASTHVDRLLFRGVPRLVAELLQIGCGLDRPPNGPDDDAEDVARRAESRSDPRRHLGRVEDDDWEGDDPYP